MSSISLARRNRVVENEEDRAKLQQEIDNLMGWTEKWQMQFNASKCCVMHLGKNNPQFTYTMGGYAPAGVVLSSSEEEKDVGVLVRNNLKPSSQCSKAAKKANQVLGQMSRSFHYRDKYTWIRLYKTYIRCHLEYCIQAWSPWTVADKEVLEKVQKRAVGLVSGLVGKTYEEKLAECGLTTLEERRIRGDMIQTWKIIQGVDAVNKETWFSMAAGEGAEQLTRSAGNHLNILKPRYKNDLRKNWFSIRVCETWNKLPMDVRQAKNIDSFKIKYDDWIKQARIDF